MTNYNGVINLACILLLALIVVGDVNGQGFSGINGRNHPELDWVTVDTEHFHIVYPTRLSGIELLAAAIAEESYRALEANLGVSFDDRIRIYLSDEDEIANGFAMSIGNGHTNIWVHVNDVAEQWTGSEKWLRKVIAHELAHIFHYRAVKSPLRPLDHIIGSPLPRFWTEGLAQYLTEDWDAFRGEQWLRTAVLDDRLSYRDGTSRWNGQLLYATGNSQVRYFAEQYGDSTLADLLTVRKPFAFGLIKTHDFNHAFRKTTGASYREFRENWRRHINIQYNTLAAGMESIDSLGSEPLDLGGQYIDDVRGRDAFLYSRSLESMVRPITRLTRLDLSNGKESVLAEGSILSQISVSDNKVVFARRSRGEAGSIVPDLFVYDGESDKTTRVTVNRRASSPDFLPGDDNVIAYVASNGGTANIVVRELGSDTERQLTSFSGDVQLGRIRWSPDGSEIAFSEFSADGVRRIRSVSVEDGSIRSITTGTHDDRGPVWSPDGAGLAYTSLRDGVPNVFIKDSRGFERRVTNVVTGATVVEWIDSSHSDTLLADRLIVIANKSKSANAAYVVDPDRIPFSDDIAHSERLSSWTRHRPKAEVPSQISPDSSLLQNRGTYNSFKNLTHTFSLASPYINSASDWGLFGLTSWMEPLGKHLLLASGGLSVPSPGASSFISLAYVNRQFTPTLQVSAFHIPTSVRPYGDTIIEERSSGGSLTAFWPLDRFAKPYRSTVAFTRARTMFVDPVNPDSLPVFANLPTPEAGSQHDMRFGVVTRKLRPYRHNVVHPLDGYGVRVRTTVGMRNSDIEHPFVIGDVSAYSLLRAPGTSRFLVYGRLQAQEGRTLAQNYMGLSRFDELRISSPGVFELTFSDVERVRGYRTFAVGNRLAFGTIEYRVPIAPSLQTRILGFLSFGKTTASLFADAAIVFNDGNVADADKRLGLGVELKNALSIGGFTFMHAFGMSQPEHLLFTDDIGYYYRIRTSLPF